MEVLPPSSSFASLEYPQYPPRRSSLDYALAMNGGRDITCVTSQQSRVTHVIRGALHSPRAFAPLTPIIASPLCTPTISTDSAFTLGVQLEEDGSGPVTAAQDNQQDELLNIPPSLTTKTLFNPSSISTSQTLPSTQVPRLDTLTTRQGPLQSISYSRSFPGSQLTPKPSPSIKLPHRRFSHPPITPLTPYSSSWDNPPSLETAKVEPFCITPIGPRRQRSVSPLFHISLDGYSDNEDDEHANDGHRETSPDGTTSGLSQGASSTDRSSESLGSSVRRKDDIRRYHALMELLTTEAGYLEDLRVLVTVYLRRLPTLTCRSSSSNSLSNGATGSFGRNTSSSLVPPFSSLSRASSFIAPNPIPVPSTTSQDTHIPHTVTPSSVVREKDKSSPRYVFSDTDVEVITRNAEELLQLHELFLEELRGAITSLGFPMSPEDSKLGFEVSPSTEEIDAAIGVVSTKFATEASRFNSYQAFCSGHLEAFDLLRKIQQQRPAEWDIFERQSSLLVSDITHHRSSPPQRVLDAESLVSTEVSTGLETKSSDVDKKRRHSLPTLEISTHTPLVHTKLKANMKVSPSDTHERSNKAKEKAGHARLAFTDYLIKPVQRICRYPLLLDQLKTRKPARPSQSRELEPRIKHVDFHPGRQASDMNVVVESASQAMRHVASSVDEAGRRQYISIQSSLIVSRIHLAWSSPAYSAHRAFHLLTPAFLSSLGACLLAGSLDVMHYRSTKPPSAAKTKYLGAFLYMGGYLVLVKVCKGKVYEPRHWFSLIDVDLTDLPDEDAKLPYSFLLSSTGHHFVMGAPCQGEKEAWISAIRESLTVHPSWSHEPTSSLQFGAKRDLITEASQLLEARTTLQSVPGFDGDQEPNHAEERLLSSQTDRQRAPRLDFFNKTELSPSRPSTPSRRSSSASVKSIFSPLSSDTSAMARRPSLAVRAHVDRGLEDVISEPCRTARYYASTRDEVPLRLKPTTPSRSSSGLSVAGVMTVTAKSKSARCEASRVNGGDSETLPATLKKSPPKRKLSGRYRKKGLKIVPISVTLSDGEDRSHIAHSPTQDTLPDSPVALSFCSSTTTSNPGSSLTSPITDLMPVPASPRNNASAITAEPCIFLHERDCQPKRTRSMVDNVRGLFYPQPVSPISAISETSTQHPAIFVDSETEMHDVAAAPPLLKWWAKGSLRRRARSAPDVPSEDIPSSHTASVDSDVSSTSRQIMVTPDGSQDSHDDDTLTQLPTTPLCYSSSATKRLSLFCASSTRRTPNSIIINEAESSRRSHKNIPLLHRLSPMNPGGL